MSILEFAQKRMTEKMRAKTDQIRHCGKCNFLLCKNIQGGKKKQKNICANEGKVHFMSEKRQLLNASVRHQVLFGTKKMLQNRYLCNLKQPN